MRMTRRNQRGFTLVEMMVVISLALIIMAMAIGGVPSMLKTSRADAGLTELAMAIRFARESAISARRNVALSFGSNTITITRAEYCPSTCTSANWSTFPGCNQPPASPPGSPCPAKQTALRTITLEGRNTFQLMGVGDTPDTFGASTEIALGPKTPAMFTTDGSFIDSSGDPLNGSLFIGITADRTSARALTIFGPTGAMHLWRWDGRKWVEV
jgi:prepilin-type N-terminal cleavage/methylation domain-containing protein